MSANRILILQSIGVTLQMINVAIGVDLKLDPIWCVIVSAIIGGYQFYVQHLGNQKVTPDA